MAHGLLVDQIQLRMAADAQVFISRTPQGTANGAACQAAVPGHKNFPFFCNMLSSAGREATLLP